MPIPMPRLLHESCRLLTPASLLSRHALGFTFLRRFAHLPRQGGASPCGPRYEASLTRAAPGIEPGTSRTRSENRATRPSSQVRYVRRAKLPPFVTQPKRRRRARQVPRKSCSYLAPPSHPASSSPRHSAGLLLKVLSLAVQQIIWLAGVPETRHASRGLLRELNPGPLAPEARIMPLDQAAK